MLIDLYYTSYNSLNFDINKYAALTKKTVAEFYKKCVITVTEFGTFRLIFKIENAR
jgi:hypothetical protein